MKKILILLIVLLFGTTLAVHAIPYTDEYNANGLFISGSLIGAQITKSWTFDITMDEHGNPWFDPETQDITSASILLKLRDDKGCDFLEFAYLDVGDSNFLWEVDEGDASFTMSALMTLSNTGKVNASLTAIWGDFYFDSALLTAEGTLSNLMAKTFPVPEPAAILLFGTGLAGLTFATRRRLFPKHE